MNSYRYSTSYHCISDVGEESSLPTFSLGLVKLCRSNSAHSWRTKMFTHPFCICFILYYCSYFFTKIM